MKEEFRHEKENVVSKKIQYFRFSLSQTKKLSMYEECPWRELASDPILSDYGGSFEGRILTFTLHIKVQIFILISKYVTMYCVLCGSMARNS